MTSLNTNGQRTDHAVGLQGEIDPYAVWLDLPEGPRPPDPYTLLRLEKFESNAKLIAAGKERQHRALQAIESTAPARLWKRIHSEVRVAAERLLSERSKRVIDAQLKRKDLADGRGIAPANPSSDTVECPCGVTSSSRTAFCKSCGTALWVLCARCGHSSGVDERFCGECGCELAVAFSELERRIAGALNSGAEALEQKRFHAAVDMLYTAALTTDPRLSETADKAMRLLEQMDSRRSEARKIASDALTESRRAIEDRRFDEAIELLESLPKELVTAEHEGVLAEAMSVRSRVESLHQEIRKLIAQKQLGGVGGRIDELLVLDPFNESVQELAAKMSKQIIKKAVGYAREGRFGRGQALLNEIPQGYDTDDARKLGGIIAEVLWIADAIRTAPVVDEILPRLVERWKKIDPRRAEEADSILKKVTNHRWGDVWRPGSDGPFSTPIELGLRFDESRWDLSETPRRSEWRKANLRFAPALGLALQLLGKGGCTVNMLDEKKSMLTGLLRRPKPTRVAWGVDMGEFSAKAVKLELRDDERVAISDWLYLEHDANRPGLDDDERTQRLGDAVREIQAWMGDGSDKKIGYCLPGHQFISRSRRAPLVNNRKGRLAMENLARESFPIELDRLVWRYQALESLDDNPGTPILLLATRTEHMEQNLSILEGPKLDPTLVQCDFLAMYNYATYELMAPDDEERRDPVLLIDFGYTGATVVFCEPDLVFSRALPIGGRQVSEAISKHLQVTWEAAEKIKRNPLRVKNLHELHESVRPRWRHLVTEIEKSIDSCRRELGGGKLRRIHAVGGSFLQHGALRELFSSKASNS